MAWRRGGRFLLAVLAAGVATVVVRADSRQLDALVQLQLGDLLYNDARFEDAAQAYRAAWTTASGPERIQAGNGLVRSLLRTAAYRTARPEAEQLVRLAASNAESLALSGDALWVAGWFEEAEVRYRASLATRADYPPALDGLARSLAARNLLDEALELATRATNQATRLPEHLHTLGFIHERMRRYELAATAYADYLQMLSPRSRARRAGWTERQTRFLRSFGAREPSAMTPEVAAATHVVPFRLVRNKIVVAARVNGGRAFDMVLDTGAEMTALTRRTAGRLGIEPIVATVSAGVGQIGIRALQLGRIDSLQIGTLRVDNVPTLIKSPALRDLPANESDGFSPLAWGLSVQVDYARRLLTIARELPDSAADTALPLRMHRLATVRGSVNSANAVNFVVDTGGEVISISRSVFELLNTQPPRRIPLKVYGVSGWDPDAFLMPGLDVAFEHVSLPNLSVVVLNLDAPSSLLGFDLGGIVGHKFLGKYHVSIDLPRSELRLKAM